MGLFKNLFGNKQQDATSKLPTHKEEWDTYLTNVDHKLGSILLDLGFKSIAPIKDKASLVWISIQMNNPREDGLSSTEESDKLYEIEDRLVNALTQKFDCVYPGRLTSNGHRDLYFYFSDSLLFDKTISEVMVAYPTYEYDFGVKEDTNWTAYLNFLYPLPSQYQTMLNRRVLENLRKAGDNHDLPRKVDHYLFFKASSDRSSFINQIDGLGFSIENQSEGSEFDHSFSLHLTKTEKVEYDTINETTIKLAEEARNFNSYYDGWGCPIEK
ncbi:DUF695 domain-containing protein [Pedobacter fastidiosus]|uniref:DUF695 domain-containing protein n=1 Tax=Pedobacter fastidiosus TaxID=2765361 RepID=A0ABR7KLF7_9SPHI|nr:DUF695 domain-containing protein [Pedobacter fastidiosus]MBC6108910.1 DUF695 domain-containing protein [Pedobacter fastidiosus]